MSNIFIPVLVKQSMDLEEHTIEDSKQLVRSKRKMEYVLAGGLITDLPEVTLESAWTPTRRDTMSFQKTKMSNEIV